MVYEIYFDPKAAVWRIRITTFCMFFFPISKIVQSKTEQGSGPKDFATFDDANRYARRVGLDNAYQRRERRLEHTSQVQGVLAHGSSDN